MPPRLGANRGDELIRDLHPQILDQEGELIGHVFDDFRGWFAGAMAGASFDPDQDRRRTGLRFLQGGGKLETVAGKNAVIVIGGRNERGRILRARFDVVERRILVDGREFLRVIGRAVIRGPGPADRELLEAQHVHHADRGQRRAPKIGPLI